MFLKNNRMHDRSNCRLNQSYPTEHFGVTKTKTSIDQCYLCTYVVAQRRPWGWFNKIQKFAKCASTICKKKYRRNSGSCFHTYYVCKIKEHQFLALRTVSIREKRPIYYFLFFFSNPFVVDLPSSLVCQFTRMECTDCTKKSNTSTAFKRFEA